LTGIEWKNPDNFESEYCFHVPAISGVFLQDPVTFPDLSCRIPRDLVAGIIDLGMAELKILPPTIIMRTSDYMNEIIVYVKKIIANGNCDESNSSIYLKNSNSDKEDKYNLMLWQKSEAFEPLWTSPCGNGRSGPLINCSVMCNILFSKNVLFMNIFIRKFIYCFYFAYNCDLKGPCSTHVIGLRN
jgi:hypothetical protein